MNDRFLGPCGLVEHFGGLESVPSLSMERSDYPDFYAGNILLSEKKVNSMYTLRTYTRSLIALLVVLKNKLCATIKNYPNIMG